MSDRKKTSPRREKPLKITLQFSPKAVKKFKAIKRRARLKSNAEVIKNGLRLYDWFLQTRRDGFKIHKVKGKKVIELDLQF